MVLADTALTPFDAGTFGSRTTPTVTPQLRKVAAAARDLLVAKAAKQWNVPAEKLVAGDGEGSGPAAGKMRCYGGLSGGENNAAKPPPEGPVKTGSPWRVVRETGAQRGGAGFVNGGL